MFGVSWKGIFRPSGPSAGVGSSAVLEPEKSEGADFGAHARKVLLGAEFSEALKERRSESPAARMLWGP